MYDRQTPDALMAMNPPHPNYTYPPLSTIKISFLFGCFVVSLSVFLIHLFTHTHRKNFQKYNSLMLKRMALEKKAMKRIEMNTIVTHTQMDIVAKLCHRVAIIVCCDVYLW